MKFLEFIELLKGGISSEELAQRFSLKELKYFVSESSTSEDKVDALAPYFSVVIEAQNIIKEGKVNE